MSATSVQALCKASHLQDHWWVGLSVPFSSFSPQGYGVFGGNRGIHVVGFSWQQNPS